MTDTNKIIILVANTYNLNKAYNNFINFENQNSRHLFIHFIMLRILPSCGPGFLVLKNIYWLLMPRQLVLVNILTESLVYTNGLYFCFSYINFVLIEVILK